MRPRLHHLAGPHSLTGCRSLGPGAPDPTEDAHIGNDGPKFRDSPNSEAHAGECQGFCPHALLCRGKIRKEPGIAFWLITTRSSLATWSAGLLSPSIPRACSRRVRRLCPASGQ